MNYLSTFFSKFGQIVLVFAIFGFLVSGSPAFVDHSSQPGMASGMSAMEMSCGASVCSQGSTTCSGHCLKSASVVSIVSLIQPLTPTFILAVFAIVFTAVVVESSKVTAFVFEYSNRDRILSVQKRE